MSEQALAALDAAMREEEAFLAPYRQPRLELLFEVLRRLDDIYCRELFGPPATSTTDRLYESYSTWGANAAVARMMPDALAAKPFTLLPTNPTVRQQANDFVFHSGALTIARRVAGWMRDGLVEGEVLNLDKLDGTDPIEVIQLNGAHESLSDEQIGRAGLRWQSDRVMRGDRPAERAFEQWYRTNLDAIEDRVSVWQGWGIAYASTPDIDAHFHEAGRLYLRRMYAQDLIGEDDVIGGRPFSRYLDVLTALSGRSQKHLAFVSLLKQRHRKLDLRNLLTAHAEWTSFVQNLSMYLDADVDEVTSILQSLTLSPDNVSSHTRTEVTAWAPAVRPSTNVIMLPLYGLEINPFIFLLNDLRERYSRDWFELANRREARWIAELEGLFTGTRWQTSPRNLMLKEGGKTLTDLDFAVHDQKDNCLVLFQLKWQQPVAGDERGRRSAAKNLAAEGNKWVETVSGWLERHGAREVMSRYGFTSGSSSPSVHLVVLGRYAAHLTGSAAKDTRATWSDWAHFKKARIEGHRKSLLSLLAALRHDLVRRRQSKETESFLLPIGNSALALNVRRSGDGYLPSS